MPTNRVIIDLMTVEMKTIVILGLFAIANSIAEAFGTNPTTWEYAS